MAELVELVWDGDVVVDSEGNAVKPVYAEGNNLALLIVHKGIKSTKEFFPTPPEDAVAYVRGKGLNAFVSMNFTVRAQTFYPIQYCKSYSRISDAEAPIPEKA